MIMLILGIETSCDETSAAIVRDGIEVGANIVSSQAELHSRYGGVVPEAAARYHLERMLPIIKGALSVADISFDDLNAVAVTNRPGLLGALLVGVSAAKALSFALQIPIIPVHHLEGHLYSAFLAEPGMITSFPHLILIVSGGHTQIVRVESHGRYALLGKTRDDAAGEAFDKGARLMGLAYPGGPLLAKLAEEGDPRKIPFPRSMAAEGLEFSFSGLKTSLRAFLARDAGFTAHPDIAASYQAAIVDVLTIKLRRACRLTGIRSLGVVGGVAANLKLQESMRKMAEEEDARMVIPPPILCTDNAAMIASAGYFRYQTSGSSSLSFDTCATESLAS